MKLYNTMSRQAEDFQPLNPPEVKLYACGFTVYDFTHLGHLRKYTLDDVLVRTLEHAGYAVTFVQNVTDVGHLASDADTGEDKLEKGAKKYGKSVWDIAHEFEDYFWRSMDAMGNKRPDVSCRATDHIAQQLAMVIELEKQGHAYVIDGDGVYFDTSTFPEYGKLARLNVEEQQEGARVEAVAGKRNPTDFALWKFERPGENRAMVWSSPWHKRSFPGWHIECSAMAMEYLGNQLDIHTGGIDHIPVHHTNEIAQAEAFSGEQPFVKYWVHHNFLQVEGEKMSKSLGNFYTIDDILERGFDPRALRLLFLTGHYRSEMNFTWESLEGAQKSYQRLLKAVAGWAHSEEAVSTTAQELQTRFYTALENDLATPEAIAVLWEVVNHVELSDSEKKQLVVDFDEILQLELASAAEKLENLSEVVEIESLPAEIQELVAQRETARKAKDWQKSDDLRNKLLQKGYNIIDADTGQKLELVHPKK